jgi:uncharacterized protein
VTASATAAAASAPVTGAERVDVLDVMRGIAVLGILLVNVDSFIGYGFDLPGAADSAAAGFNDLAGFLVEFLVQGKFYCLFSFLFGVGFSVFIQRASARGHDGIALFKRRLIGLLLIGVVHTCLIWYGDILTSYALIGFGLIPFLRRDDRAVLRAAALWLASPVAFYLVMLALARLAAPPAAQTSDAGDLPPVLANAVNSFAHGSYPDVVKGNVVFTIANVVRRLILMFFPRVFGMFLLGFWAGRANLFARLDEHAPLLGRVCVLGFTIGLPLAFAGAALGGSGSPRRPDLIGLLDMTAETIATPALALAYGSGICLLYRSFPAALRLAAPVGRMALTSYLTHSVVGVIVFYGIGFGYYGQISLPVALAGCAAVFLMQIVVSRLWLSMAAFGPIEWLWRMFTYRRRFALLRSRR